MIGQLKAIFVFSLLMGYFCINGCAYGATTLQTAPKNVSPSAPKTTSPIVSKPKSINDKYPPLKTTLPPISQAPTATAPPVVDFNACNKVFKIDSQKLFYLTLAGVNANRFSINEIQSKSGYVLFTAGQKQFLASVVGVDGKSSMLKITPCNNVYTFPIGVVQNMFKYIELNVNTPVESLSIL